MNKEITALKNGNALLITVIDDLVRKKKSLFNQDGTFSPDIEHEDLAFVLVATGVYENLGDRTFKLNQSKLDDMKSRLSDCFDEIENDN